MSKTQYKSEPSGNKQSLRSEVWTCLIVATLLNQDGHPDDFKVLIPPHFGGNRSHNQQLKKSYQGNIISEMRSSRYLSKFNLCIVNKSLPRIDEHNCELKFEGVH